MRSKYSKPLDTSGTVDDSSGGAARDPAWRHPTDLKSIRGNTSTLNVFAGADFPAGRFVFQGRLLRWRGGAEATYHLKDLPAR